MNLRLLRGTAGAMPAVVVALCLSALASASAGAAAGYMDADALSARLKELAAANPALMRVERAAQSLGGKDVWLVSLGAGTSESMRARPAMLVAAGIEGNDIAGSAAALAWIERLLAAYPKDAAVKKLLDTSSLYVFPRLNPDAIDKYFRDPILETSVSNKPVDDDRDGMIDEDVPEDLNGDGLITAMRVSDPEGEYILDPADPRLLVKADKIKGEIGAWRLLIEGADGDRDEQWNEDGVGGVNFNRNFPYGYQWFAPWAGVHQVSEPETRMLADFVVAHPNIGIVFTFGAADNLIQTPKGEQPEGRKPPTAINEKDVPYYKRAGEIYRGALGIKEELQGQSQPGTFSDWMYFHRGRLSLAAQPWSPAMQIALEKARSGGAKPADDKATSPVAAAKDQPTSPAATVKNVDAKSSPTAAASTNLADDKRNEQERAFLKWADKFAPGAFIAWKEFKHPDFPDKRVEIGGFAPFAKVAPPPRVFETIAAQQADFLTSLAMQLPRIEIRKMTSKHLGKSVYEVEVQVENTGFLPTALAQGEATNEVFSTRLVIDLEPKAFLAGNRITRLRTLAGSGGMQEARFILFVPDRKEIKLSVVSMIGGTVERTLQLDGENR